MNNQSSNSTVETQLNILSTIKHVAPRTSLFEATMQRIAQSKEPQISIVWVRAAAVIFVLLLCAEFLVLSNHQNNYKDSLTQQEQLESFLPQTNYTIYND